MVGHGHGEALAEAIEACAQAAFHAGLLDGLLGVAGIIIHNYYMDHSLIPYV